MSTRIATQLRRLGFSEKAAAIFLALLRGGEASAASIAKEASVKRTTVYNILPELMNLGLVRSASHRGRKVFFVEDVSVLERISRDRLRIAEYIVPELERIHQVLPYRASIRHYEGQQGAQDFFLDALRYSAPGDTIDEIIGPQSFYSLLPEEFAGMFVPERLQKKIRIRIIASPSTMTSELKRRASKELREVRVLEADAAEFPAAQLIYADRVGYLSLASGFVGATLHSAEIAGMQRRLFNLLWATLRR